MFNKRKESTKAVDSARIDPSQERDQFRSIFGKLDNLGFVIGKATLWSTFFHGSMRKVCKIDHLPFLNIIYFEKK